AVAQERRANAAARGEGSGRAGPAQAAGRLAGSSGRRRCGQPYPRTLASPTAGASRRRQAPVVLPAQTETSERPGIVAAPRPPAAGTGEVYLVGRRGSPHVPEYRDFLERNRVPFRWIDVDRNPL